MEKVHQSNRVYQSIAQRTGGGVEAAGSATGVFEAGAWQVRIGLFGDAFFNSQLRLHLHTTNSDVEINENQIFELEGTIRTLIEEKNQLVEQIKWKNALESEITSTTRDLESLKKNVAELKESMTPMEGLLAELFCNF